MLSTMRRSYAAVFTMLVAMGLLGVLSGSSRAATEGYTVTDLGTLGGSQGSYATDINDKGQVVGDASTSGGYGDAFLYDEGATPKMQDLGTLGGDNYSYAYDINDSGQVVGYSAINDYIGEGFLYENGQMKDLNSLIPQDSGWTLQGAIGINTAGQIVGGGVTNNQTHAFLLTPKTTPPAEPQLDLPTDIAQEATGPEGAVVTYTATATDDVDGSVPVDCSPTSGATFPVGTTTVNCSATDTDGNTANGSFKVTVKDTRAPEITGMPADQTVQTTSSSGALVTYTSPTANDTVDGKVDVKCAPASGATFPVGTTTVNCSATDTNGNTANGSFNVTVDTTPPSDTTSPETSITSGPNSPTNNTAPTFTFSGSDDVTSTANLKYQYQLDSGGWSTPPSTSTTVNLTGLSEGAHLFEVRAVDEASNVDADPAKQSFTVDTTAPKVDTVSPVNSTTGVLRSTDVEANFLEKVASDSINTSTFKLFKCSSTTSTDCATQLTNAPVSLSPEGLRATLNPYGTSSTLLASKTKYKAVLTTGVRDEAGNALNQQKVWYFTTGRT